MPSKIACPDGHLARAVSIWEAAVALSEGRQIGVCKKCGQELQYRIDHAYANDPSKKWETFTVARAVRLGTRLAGGENYDPFLLVLRDFETGEERVLPTFWAHGQNKAQRGGQFPPLLSLDEWRALFRQLGPGSHDPQEEIRLRAYELYERRGRRDGHAVDDWLEAEAELTGRKVLQAAA